MAGLLSSEALECELTPKNLAQIIKAGSCNQIKKVLDEIEKNNLKTLLNGDHYKKESIDLGDKELTTNVEINGKKLQADQASPSSKYQRILEDRDAKVSIGYMGIEDDMTALDLFNARMSKDLHIAREKNIDPQPLNTMQSEICKRIIELGGVSNLQQTHSQKLLFSSVSRGLEPQKTTQKHFTVKGTDNIASPRITPPIWTAELQREFLNNILRGCPNLEVKAHKR